MVDGAAHAEVAGEERTSRHQVARVFADRADQREACDGDAPRRLSLGEAHHRRGHEFATVVSDLDRRCVIEVLDGRDRRTLERWLSALPADVRSGIEVVSIDPYDGDRQAIRAAPRTRGSSALVRGAKHRPGRRAPRAPARGQGASAEGRLTARGRLTERDADA